MTDTIPPETDFEAWAERNAICGDYLPRIALATGVERQELICKLSSKLFDSWAKRRLKLVRDLDDIPAFDSDQSFYLALIVAPYLSEVELDEQENAAIELTIAGCKRTWLGRAIERACRNNVERHPASQPAIALEDSAAMVNEVGPAQPVSGRAAPERQAQIRRELNEVLPSTTIDGVHKVQAEVGQENLPLPQLPKDLAHEVDVAKAEALVKLHDELNAIWAACFPAQDGQRFRTPAPDQFFPPFVAYGVAMYLARAEALLELHPEPLEYQDWLNFGLKTLICDELAPCRLVENSGIPAYEVQMGAWQVHMGITWRHFDHPQHSAFFSKAKGLIDALEDPIDGHWGRFISILHNGMSRKTLSLLTKALKLLGGTTHTEPTGRVKTEAATAGQSDQAFPAPDTAEHSAAAEKPRKGDATLFADKSLVTFKKAEEYLGISERQRQSLVKQGALTVQGKGSQAGGAGRLPPTGIDPAGKAEPSQAVKSKRQKRGPTPDYKTATLVAEIVAQITGDGAWRSKLDEICYELDEKTIRPPKTWQRRGHGDWCDCLAAERVLVVKAIEHHLKLAASRPETLS